MTTTKTTEKLPEYYHQWDADTRFPDLTKALNDHRVNLEKLRELNNELASALNHVDDHVYAIRVLDYLHDDFCYGDDAAGNKVHKFMRKYCGLYDANESVSYELHRSIDVLKEEQRKNCRKVVELENQIKVAEKVKEKGWEDYRALDKKHEAEFDKLKAAEKAAEVEEVA